MESVSFLQQAIQNNNVGAHHLERNMAVALRSFHEGISCLRQAAVANDVPRESVDRCPCIVVRRAVSQTNPSIGSDLKVEEHPYFYDRPLLLDEMFCPNSMNSPSMATPHAVAAASHHVSCVLLFNYALAYHLQGQYHPDDLFHRHALKLYQTVLNLLEFTEYRPRWYTVLMVLVLNNCSEIHYQDCEYFKTERTRERVSNLMSGENQLFQSSSLLDEEDIDGIITNASMLTSPETARAA